MRLAAPLAAAALAAALPSAALAQPPVKTDVPTAKEEKDKKADERPPKPRPRLTLKPKGGTGSAIGDDAPGGGATSAEPSKGGTAGTPSGSFTGKPPTPR